MRLQNIIDKALAAVTIDAAKNSEAVDVTGCQAIGFQLVNSAASSPTGISVTLQRSNDGDNWVADGSATNITANGVLAIEKVDPSFRFYRLAYAWGSGSIVVNARLVGKGYV